MGRARERLTFANVTSVVAVFIALGGTAVAVTQLPKDSVGARQIKKGAVRSPEVKDFSLNANDLAKGLLPAVQSGAAGPQGPQGPQGPIGRPGAPATQIFAFVRTGKCCGGGEKVLNPPQLAHAHGVTGAEVAGTGLYEVTFDTSQLPGGSVNSCVPMVAEGSNDAAYPVAGEISVGHPNNIPDDKLLVLFRNSAGTLADLGSGGGSDGFSIALLC
jgi:hypothetical protein